MVFSDFPSVKSSSFLCREKRMDARTVFAMQCNAQGGGGLTAVANAAVAFHFFLRLCFISKRSACVCFSVDGGNYARTKIMGMGFTLRLCVDKPT